MEGVPAQRWLPVPIRAGVACDLSKRKVLELLDGTST